MAPRVILHMKVHCADCAKKIRRVVREVHGVESVQAAPKTGLVFITGTAHPSTIKWWIESKLQEPVTIVSDGVRAFPTYTRMEHLGPPGGYPPQPQPPAPAAYYYPYVSWAPVPPQQAYHYAPPVDRQYMPNLAPVYFNDENPNAYCVQ